MAAINFPDAPTNGQIFESGGMSWTYVAGIGWTLNSAIVEAGSGFTFIADTMPLPVNVGDTWFDSSTGASGGTSWVAIEEGPAGASEKVWVQFAPGVGAAPATGLPDASSAIAAQTPGSFLAGNPTNNGVQFVLPSVGWWLVSLSMDVQHDRGSWGFVDAWVTTISDINRVGLYVVPCRVYEPPTIGPRIQGGGAFLIKNTIPGTTWVGRCGTYNNNPVTINSLVLYISKWFA